MQAVQIDKAKRWAKQISITGVAQIIVQAVGFLSGILVIRLLPVEQYAYYTIANTMLGMMTVLSDSGISSGVMAQGGKVWQDKKKLGAVLNTGLYLRKRFAWGALVVSLPILCYLLWKQGADWITCVLITASLVPAFFAALSDNILQIVPKLHQSITPLQRNQVYVGIGRLLLSALTLFAFPWAFVAVLASGIPRIWGNRKLQKIAEPYVDRSREINEEVQNEIMNMVKRIMPGAIYFAFSGQITVWLLSVVGTTSSLAQIGALGRLVMVTTILSTVVTTLVVPRFAKLRDVRSLLLSKFVKINIGLFLLVVVGLALVYLFAPYLLIILGPTYAELQKELFLSFLANITMLIAGIHYGLASSRGWIMNPSISISFSLFGIVVGILLFTPSTLIGVLRLNVFLAFVQFIINVSYSTFKIFKIK